MSQLSVTRMKPRPTRLLCVVVGGISTAVIPKRRKVLLLVRLQLQLLLQVLLVWLMLLVLLIRGGRGVPSPVTLRCPLVVRPRRVVQVLLLAQGRLTPLLLAIIMRQTQRVVRVLRLRRERRFGRRLRPQQPGEVDALVEQAGILWKDAEPRDQLVERVRHRAGRRGGNAGNLAGRRLLHALTYRRQHAWRQLHCTKAAAAHTPLQSEL